jgi:hypothetical protein
LGRWEEEVERLKGKTRTVENEREMERYGSKQLFVSIPGLLDR